MDPRDQAPGKTPNGLRPSTEGNAETPSEATGPRTAGPRKTMRTEKGNESHLKTAKKRSDKDRSDLTPNGVELEAERRKPSGEKYCDIEDIPSLTGVLAHFRLHLFNAVRT